MVMACGAEYRTSKRYSQHVEESKKHAMTIVPLISTNFSLVVSLFMD
jgi:hypothetical protein